MRRVVLFAAMAVLSFVATVWARGGFTAPAGPATPSSDIERSAPVGETAEKAELQAQALAQQLSRRRVVEVSNEDLTAFQKLTLDRPAEASALHNAVMEATAKSRYERGVNLEDCATRDELPGSQTLRFAATVSSDEATFRSEPWRFIEVVDGSPIPAEVIACMERALGGPYTGARPNYAAFPASFAGDLELVYKLPAYAPAD